MLSRSRNRRFWSAPASRATAQAIRSRCCREFSLIISFVWVRAIAARDIVLQLFGDGFGLREEQKIIRATSLGIRSTHVEAAEGMRSHHCAGAFAIEVKIADVEHS